MWRFSQAEKVLVRMSILGMILTTIYTGVLIVLHLSTRKNVRSLKEMHLK